MKIYRSAACGREPLTAADFVHSRAVHMSVIFNTCTYLAGVQHLHIARGYGDPLKGMSRTGKLVLNSLKRQMQDRRLPITPWILQKSVIMSRLVPIMLA